MRYTPLLALGAGTLAMAAAAGNSSASAVSAASATGADMAKATDKSDAPETIGKFQLVGCSSSSDGFSGFQKIATDDKMTADKCASQCNLKHMGVSKKNCFCGDDLDVSKVQQLDNSACENAPMERRGISDDEDEDKFGGERGREGDWFGKKGEDWSDKKGEDWSGKKGEDWSDKKGEDWSGKKGEDWPGKHGGGEQWPGKKGDGKSPQVYKLPLTLFINIKAGEPIPIGPPCGPPGCKPKCLLGEKQCVECKCPEPPPRKPCEDRKICQETCIPGAECIKCCKPPPPPPCPPPPPPPKCEGCEQPKPAPPPPPPGCKGENCPPPPPPGCKGENCPKPGPAPACTGDKCPKPPVIAGAAGIAANILGAVAGLLFVL